jgi:AcrR family transcriptional regulator
MNITRRSPDETRQCILVAAWDLFRQVGFRKTTVADIAGALGMSSANIYRFFPSKDALTAAICRNQLDLLVGTARKAAAGPGSASERIRAVLMSLYRDLREQMTNHKRVHEVVAVALEEEWPAIDEFLEACKATVAGLVEQGQASGEFGPGDPAMLGEMTMAASAAIHHPTLIAHCSGDLEAEALVAFALRALANQNPPVFSLGSE